MSARSKASARAGPKSPCKGLSKGSCDNSDDCSWRPVPLKEGGSREQCTTKHSAKRRLGLQVRPPRLTEQQKKYTAYLKGKKLTSNPCTSIRSQGSCDSNPLCDWRERRLGVKGQFRELSAPREMCGLKRGAGSFLGLTKGPAASAQRWAAYLREHGAPDSPPCPGNSGKSCSSKELCFPREGKSPCALRRSVPKDWVRARAKWGKGVIPREWHRSAARATKGVNPCIGLSPAKCRDRDYCSLHEGDAEGKRAGCWLLHRARPLFGVTGKSKSVGAPKRKKSSGKGRKKAGSKKSSSSGKKAPAKRKAASKKPAGSKRGSASARVGAVPAAVAAYEARIASPARAASPSGARRGGRARKAPQRLGFTDGWSRGTRYHHRYEEDEGSDPMERLSHRKRWGY